MAACVVARLPSRGLRHAALRPTQLLPTPLVPTPLHLPRPRHMSANPAMEGSLIPSTLEEMDSDAAAHPAALRAAGKQRLSLEERKKRRRALDAIGVPDFVPFLAQQGVPAASLCRDPTTTLQVNVGLYCNQACTHCHVESSPRRTEAMSLDTVERILGVLASSKHVHTVDITGGAPEMNAAFRPLVVGARRLGLEVIDRCNLTVLCEPGMEDLASFLADNGVRVVASMPCYSAENVNKQRGNKVFDRSIEGLRILNQAGYGMEGSELKLDLVYNPAGAFLPPPQGALREKYAAELLTHFGIRFNELFTMTNMPIKRFADLLYKQGKLAEYMQLLVDNFNPSTVDSLMCKSLVSVAYDGSLYDCDFNQALAMPLHAPGRASIFELNSLDDLTGERVASGNHCFGCTAGMGSS